jgi:hypothetical protein
MNIYPETTFFGIFVMATFPLIGLLFDALLPRHRAVLATLLFGFLFLPSVEIDFLEVILLNRRTYPILVVLMGVFVRDWALLVRLRPRWFDLPIIVWCLVPFASAVTNGYGAREGFSLVLYQSLRWGGAYFLGRLHFQTKEQLLDLAKALFLGGIIYLPLCLFEIRMAPVLHYYLYGFNQHSFLQSIRGDHYRPIVFLQHGLMVAMWMAMTAYLGWVLGSARFLGRFLGLSLKVIPVLMAITVLVMQSYAAIVFGFTAVAATIFSRNTRSKSVFLVLAVVPILWAAVRTTGVLSTTTLARATSVISPERAQSFTFRLHAEDAVAAHVLRQPIFGWSTRGFNKMSDGSSEVVDGLWIIAFGEYGLVGLMAVLLLHLVPFLIVIYKVPPKRWRDDPFAFLAGAMGVVIVIIAMDNVFNAMVNPMFLLLIGALPALVTRANWYSDSEPSKAIKPTWRASDPFPFKRGFGT